MSVTSRLSANADEDRLKRIYLRLDLDADRLSELHWLIVEETLVFTHGPEARAVPIFSMDFRQDLRRIEPHKSRFPAGFENALLFMMLVPWETWSTLKEVDSHGFHVPWVYTVDSDIFVRPAMPQSPTSLTLGHRVYDDGFGGTYDEKRPVPLPLGEPGQILVMDFEHELGASADCARLSVEA